MDRRSMAGNYGLIMMGVFLIRFAVKSIYDPASVVTGDVSGLAIIAKELWSVPLWLTNTLLNILSFVTGLYAMGWRLIKRTLLSTVILSVSLYVSPKTSYMGSDILLSALFDDIINSVGTGIVFLTSRTTGDTDMLTALIQKRMRHYTLAQIMQVLDGIIMLTGVTILGIPTALYVPVAIFYVPKVTDGLIENLKFSKQVYTIPDNYRETVDAVLERMRRGVTSPEIRGMYSNKEKEMLFCVVSKKETIRIGKIVSELDIRAFVIASNTREVFGEGFIEY